MNRWPFALALAAVILIAWGGALSAWFANDDFLWLDVSRLPLVVKSFAGAAGVTNDFRPLVRVSFLIDWFLYGDQALGWHLTNLALHFLCAFLFWRLAARWTGVWVAALAALLFAASPLLQENVVWISGRSGSLSCAFGLACLLCFSRFLRERRAVWLVAAILADLAAFASYEAMIVLPLFVIAMAWARGAWRAVAILVAAHVLLAIYRRLVLGGHVSYALRPLSAEGLAGLWRDYAPYFPAFCVPLAGFALGLAALAVPRNWPLARVAGWAALVGLVLMLPFLAFRGAASRFFYDGMLAAALIFAILIRALCRLLPSRTGVAATAVLGAILLGQEIARTRSETADWVQAGALGQELVTKIAAADPAPDRDALHIVVGLPVLVGNGELFFTYPDRAIRRFSRLEFDALFAGHQIIVGDGPGQMAYLRKLLSEENATRARKRGTPLQCLDHQLAAAASPEAFLRGAQSCGLDVLVVNGNAVSRMNGDDFWRWYRVNVRHEG